MSRVDEARNAAHEQGDLTDIIHREVECEACGGSRIEEVYVGHGCVIEYECGSCATASTTSASGNEQVAASADDRRSREEHKSSGRSALSAQGTET